MKLAEAYVLEQTYGNLFPLEECLYRGTIFKDLYSKYKFEPSPQFENDKAKRILNIIRELKFAIWDLHLFLDTHSESQEAIAQMVIYQEELKKLQKYYEENFQKITLGINIDNNQFTWIDNPWPWSVN